MKITKSLLALFMLLALLLAAGCDGNTNTSKGESPAADKPAATDKANKSGAKDSAEKTISLKVYYPDDNGMKLLSETRSIETKGDKYKAAMESLLEGPKVKGEVRVIPAKTKLKSIKVKDGVATVDFSEDLSKRFTGGSTGEEMLVGSIVNTLTEFSEVKSVQLLVEGKKVESLSGHMDLSKPVGRMKELLK